MRLGTVVFSENEGKHSDGKGGECQGRSFAVKSVGVGGVYTNVVVCHLCDRELIAYENGLAPTPLFYVTQKQGGLQGETWDMTETALYGFVRTKTDMTTAEMLLEELQAKGAATVRYEVPLYGQTILEIRRA